MGLRAVFVVSMTAAAVVLVGGTARGQERGEAPVAVQAIDAGEATSDSAPEAPKPGGSEPEHSRPEHSKKERFLVEKSERRPIRLTRAPRADAGARPVLSIRNLWTHEVLPVAGAKPPAHAAVDGFLRDHYTNQATSMDPRLLAVVLKAASRFKSTVVEVVSGYRAPKYNLMLRKKGHAVARESQHPLGHALDFRLFGVNTRQLYRYVRSLRLGGVGYYPHSAFVHADVGKVRVWKGD